MKTRATILFVFISASVYCQVVISTDALVTVQPGTIISSTVEVMNYGTLINNGSLVLSGAWTNMGTYQAGSGNVTFNSSGTQIINHNAQSFSHIQITGGGEKLFLADLHVTNELSLQSGILRTPNNSRLLLDVAAIVNGGSDASFVQGPVYTLGTGHKLYPVGINDRYLPFTFDITQGDSPFVGIEVFESNPNTQVDFTLKEVSPYRYWKVTAQSFEGGTATVPMVEENYSTDLVVVAQATDEATPFSSAGQFATSPETGYTLITSKELITKGYVAVALESSDKTISVFNAVTPGTDGKHDFLKIVNIENYPDNVVTIINRWGAKVFEITGYNNNDRIFNGFGNSGGSNELTDGTYYYIIDLNNGEDKINGYFLLTR